MSAKFCLLIGALLGGLAVAAGAMGAHALKTRLSSDQLANFETAVRYLMYHALALLAAGLIAGRSGCGSWAAVLFVFGCLLFSGGLLVYIFTDIKPLVQVVPIGGVALILGWLLLAWEGLSAS